MPELIRIPAYNFVGPVLPDVEVAADAWLRDPQNPGRQQLLECIGSEPAKTEEQLLVIQGILSATTQWCAEKFGLDVTERLPGNENIHILEPERVEPVWNKWSEYYVHPALELTPLMTHDMGGFTDENRDLVAGNYDPAALAILLQHEIFHLVSYTGLRIRQLPDGGGGIDAYRIGASVKRCAGKVFNSFIILNEFGTEQSALEIRKDYWPSHEVLANLNDGKSGYQETMQVGKRLIERTALVLDESEEDILRCLQWDQLTGTSNFNRLLYQVWGRGVIQGLVDMHPADAHEMLELLDEVDDL